MRRKAIFTLMFLMFATVGVYSVVEDFALIKKMDREAIIFLSSLLIGSILYGTAVYLISNRNDQGMSVKAIRAWFMAGNVIRYVCILCASYLGLVLFFCLFPKLLPFALIKIMGARLLTTLFFFSIIALILLFFGCLVVGLIKAVLEPVVKKVR